MSEPQSQAKAHQCRIFDAASIRKDSAAIGKYPGVRIDAELHSASHVVGPLCQVLEFPAATAEYVRRHGDLIDRQTQDQAPVHPIRQLPLLDVTIRANPHVAREEVV